MSNTLSSLDPRDFPIRESGEDRLERGPFAKLLAEALLAPNPERSTVLGLTGRWGTGKTSVANLVRERIGTDATVVVFEPWMVSSREALAREFFATVGKAVLPSNNTSTAKQKRARYYKYVASLLGVVSVAGTAVPGGGIGGKAASSISTLLNDAAEGLELQAAEPSLREARDEIARDLQKLKKPVIIIVDDIDRLDTSEVRATFQLIKACADFPNVRYLLLFDQEQVLHALADTVNDAQAFLEKIISQVFDLPEATSRQRSVLLDQAITDLGLHMKLRKFDRDRLASVFDEILLPGLSTMRHVKRFTATIRSLLPGVVVDGFRNIDPADFLALEFLRQYVPTVYSVLRDEQAPIPGGRFIQLLQNKDRKERVQEMRTATLDSLAEPMKSLAGRAVGILFDVFSTGSAAVATRRFATDFWKPVYLGFHEARAGVPEKKWQEFLTRLKTPEKEQAWLKEWDDRHLRDQWVASIGARALEIEWPESISLIAMILKWGDAQTREISRWESPFISWPEAAKACIETILSVTPDELDPVQEMRKAVEGSQSLVCAANIVGLDNSRDEYRRWSQGYDLAPLVKPLQKRYRQLMRSGQIWETPDVHAAFNGIYYLLGDRSWKAWYSSLYKSEEKLILYLNRELGLAVPFTSGFREGEPMIEAIRSIDPEKLNEVGKRGRTLALRATTGHRDRAPRRPSFEYEEYD